MENLNKYLYLLQLEEYQTDRFIDWLDKYAIENLEERKGKLKNTIRIRLTRKITRLLVHFSKPQKAIINANNFLGNFFTLAELLIVWTATVKLSFYPKLTRIIITGSYGKTTFKEKLAWLLSQKYQVLNTPGNINTRIGIARLILNKLTHKDQIFIIEAGAYKRGEIKSICQMVKPDFGIVTIIGWMHLSRFKILENIRKTKLEIVPFIKDSHKLFIPEKDHQFIDFDQILIEIAFQLGFDRIQAQTRLSSFQQPEHRLVEKQLNEYVTLLDDTYNSNPLGFEKAINQLASYKKLQKILVTPGMIDLGEKQDSLNEEITQKVAKIADIFVIVGETNQQSLEEGIKKADNKNLTVLKINPEDDLYLTLSTYLNKPTVILHENDLPDNYF